MKNYSHSINVSLVFVAAIFVSGCSQSGTDKTAAKSEQQNVLNRSQTLEADGGAGKDNSFSVGTISGKEKDNLDSPGSMLERGKNYLLTQLDGRLSQLSAFKNQIQTVHGLSESERKGLVTELDSEVEKFSAFKPEVAQTASKDEISNLAEKIKAEWIKSRLVVARIQKRVVTERESQLVSDAESASVVMQKRLEQLKASGKNTESYEKLMSEYNDKLALAKKDVDTAEDKADAAVKAANADEKTRLLQAKEESEKNARDSLKEGYKLVGKEARREFSERYK